MQLRTAINSVGAKHSGDQTRNFIYIFLSECFALLVLDIRGRVLAFT
jgi:hypothetical protein